MIEIGEKFRDSQGHVHECIGRKKERSGKKVTIYYEFRDNDAKHITQSYLTTYAQVDKYLTIGVWEYV